MSNHVKPFQTFMDRVIEDQMRRGLTTNNVLNINALDELDPVHYRTERASRDQGEADHDGDMGREQQDYDRDNGRLHLRGGSGIAPWRQIADALPTIEAPSIAPDEIPAPGYGASAEAADRHASSIPDRPAASTDSADRTIAYLHKREGSE